MRIFVTGGTGFIGSHVCRQLLSSGHEVLAIVRNLDHPRLKSLQPKPRVLFADLSQIDAVATQLKNFSPQATIHLAWEGGAWSHRDDVSQIRNIELSTKLIQCSARAGARIFVGIGSQAEYGPKTGPISVGALEEPSTMYGEVKLATGRVCKKMCALNEMRFVWLRVFSTYGPDDNSAWLLPSVTNKLLKGERPALTMGDQIWDFLHVDDAARAIELATVQRKVRGVYNLGSGNPIRLKEVLLKLRNLIDPSLPLGFGEIGYRKHQTMHLCANISTLTQDSTWKPIIGLEEGLKELIHASRIKAAGHA